MQTILGAGGAVGNALAQALKLYDAHTRLVSRHPKKVNDTDELLTADLLNETGVAEAVQGSDVVYLTAGLEYKTSVWQSYWPEVMHNVIEACKQHNAKLVFFDNIYMYEGADLSNITEETPQHPPSRKGHVRQIIAQNLLNEIHAGNINALIARSPDFYGPHATSSVLTQTVIGNLQKGKKAQWLGDVSKVHSFGYVPDLARATALLGNSPDAYNQVWHLPTSTEKITGKEWIEKIANAMNKPAKFSVYSKQTVRFIGFFVPVLREIHEMMYQYDRDYFFNSDKFMQRFPDFKVTPSDEGIRATVAAL